MKEKNFVQIDNISYTYPVGEELEDNDQQTESKPAIDGIELGIEQGQFICILGSNGSGKSTLARHLNALLVPDEGTVWINGINSTDEEHLWEIRSDVGMVFQNPDNQIIASRVDEEVAFGLENLGVPSEEIIEKVSAALKSVGMNEHFGESPLNLSGGQKQRVAIAGILAMQPKCIVLDESTAMLDPKGRDEIMDTVIKLNKEAGITLICITHFMEEAVDADMIFVMDKGHITAKGRPEDIFTDNDKLSQAGLKLPIACQIAEKLREKGIDIPGNIIKIDDLAEYLSGKM